jgi:DNA-binding LytR/AlgR family response regulator
VNALDYLLKPVRVERLSNALERLRPAQFQDASASAAAPPLEYTDYLFVSSGTNARFLKISAIKYILAAGSYSEVFAADGRKYLLLQPIKDWEARLPAGQFVRTHRSCVVNLEYVERVEALGNDTFHIFLRCQRDPLPISRRYAQLLKDRLR